MTRPRNSDPPAPPPCAICGDSLPPEAKGKWCPACRQLRKRLTILHDPPPVVREPRVRRVLLPGGAGIDY
jgi:hypothetical protein